MKLLIVAGTQPRHRFVVECLVRNYLDSRIILMERENMIPTPPDNLPDRDRRLFEHHFSLRETSEERYFGVRDSSRSFLGSADLLVPPDRLNDSATARFIDEVDADVCLVFGTDLIKEPVLGRLPELTFNIHLGLSPWYRGSATLFWPFYFMEPQWAGVTIHKLIAAVDHGDIAFQSCPSLSLGMGIHDVGSSAVVATCDPLLELLSLIDAGTTVTYSRQRSAGRIFRVKDFRPAHLRVNYEIFEDRMVDAWLAGELGGAPPKLVELSNG